MFLSKGFLQLRGAVTKAFGENVLIAQRFSSVIATEAAQQSAEQPVPDKLYQKLVVEVRGNDSAVLRSYGQFACMAADNLGIEVARNFAIPKAVHQRETVLKSVHIYKKHRVQYETRTYFRYLDFLHLTGSTADTYLEYLQRNLPEGVAMKVTKVEIQRLPESLMPPNA